MWIAFKQNRYQLDSIKCKMTVASVFWENKKIYITFVITLPEKEKLNEWGKECWEFCIHKCLHALFFPFLPLVTLQRNILWAANYTARWAFSFCLLCVRIRMHGTHVHTHPSKQCYGELMVHVCICGIMWVCIIHRIQKYVKCMAGFSDWQWDGNVYKPVIVCVYIEWHKSRQAMPSLFATRAIDAAS